MTDSSTPAASVDRNDGALQTFLSKPISALVLGILGFGVAGGVVVQALLTLRDLSIPLADTMNRSLLSTISVVPWWVDPVTLQPQTVLGLKAPYAAVAIGLWIVSVTALAVASSLYWWHSSTERAGLFPPADHLARCCVLAIGAGITLVAVEFLIPVDGWFGWAVIGIVAGVAATLLPAAVAIVTDGRSISGAAVWAGRQFDTPAWIYAVIAVLFLARVRQLLVEVYFQAGEPMDLFVVLATIAFGLLYAKISLSFYEWIEDISEDSHT